MSAQASEDQVQSVVARVKEIGLMPELSRGEERTLIGVIGGNAYAYREAFAHLPGIHEIIPITKPFKLASREFHPEDSVFDIKGVRVGGGHLAMIAGLRCAPEMWPRLATVMARARPPAMGTARDP